MTFDLEAAATLWMLGRNTNEIAQRMGVPEWECWNRLDQIKALAKT